MARRCSELHNVGTSLRLVCEVKPMQDTGVDDLLPVLPAQPRHGIEPVGLRPCGAGAADTALLGPALQRFATERAKRLVVGWACGEVEMAGARRLQRRHVRLGAGAVDGATTLRRRRRGGRERAVVLPRAQR